MPSMSYSSYNSSTGEGVVVLDDESRAEVEEFKRTTRSERGRQTLDAKAAEDAKTHEENKKTKEEQ